MPTPRISGTTGSSTQASTPPTSKSTFKSNTLAKPTFAKSTKALRMPSPGSSVKDYSRKSKSTSHRILLTPSSKPPKINNCKLYSLSSKSKNTKQISKLSKTSILLLHSLAWKLMRRSWLKISMRKNKSSGSECSVGAKKLRLNREVWRLNREEAF